jgi:hypothetical protein
MRDRATSLPTDWGRMLDDINRRLEEAVATRDARARQAAEAAPAPADEERRRDWAELRNRLGGLEERARRAREQVDDADRTLQEGELELRRQLGAAEAARQRLAAWAGRAIG